MFGTDPAKMLRKARRLLERGDALAALRLARKAQARARPPVSGEAAALLEQARRAVVADAESRAERSEADGHLADAAEWLRGALEYSEGGEERARLQARLGGLEQRLEAEHGLAVAPDDPGLGSILGGGPLLAPPQGSGRSLDGESDPDEGEPLPPEEALYRLYVDSLRDDVAELYRGRGPELGTSLIDLAEPEDAERAAAAIEELAAASPDDPVLRLERGRWRLARGETAAARDDLEAAWEVFGDQPLDLSGQLSIPVMWCEVALAQGDHPAVLERLEERGELTLSHPDLTGFYATALLAAGEHDEARRFLEESLGQFPRRPDLAYLLAGVLHNGGEATGAIAVLERSLRVCGAGCSPRELHEPSLRLLAAVLAERGGPVERLADVMLLLRGVQGGELRAPGDWMLQARCHELAGDDAAAERARARAGKMLEAAAGGERTAPPRAAPSSAPSPPSPAVEPAPEPDREPA